MDTIDVELITTWYAEEQKSDIYITLVLNGELVAGTFDPFELIVSTLYKRVRCELLTCSCGIAGCAGIFHGTYVKHRRYTVEWRDIDCRLPKKFYSFDRNSYINAVTKVKSLLHELVQYRQDYIKDEYYYGPVGFCNVEECITGVERMLEWHDARPRKMEELPYR